MGGAKLSPLKISALDIRINSPEILDLGTIIVSYKVEPIATSLLLQTFQSQNSEICLQRSIKNFSSMGLFGIENNTTNTMKNLKAYCNKLKKI